MNVYDFDKTIYQRDCTFDFYKWIILRQPGLLRYLPKQLFGFFRFYCLHLDDKTVMKKYFYSYLKSINNIDEMVEKYWDEHINFINKWYIDNHKEDDLIISASALFMVKPACDRLKIKNVLASQVNQYTGEVISKNCHGKQKVTAMLEAGYNEEIEEFYSDSYSDQPLADLAKKAFLVKDNIPTKWDRKK